MSSSISSCSSVSFSNGNSVKPQRTVVQIASLSIKSIPHPQNTLQLAQLPTANRLLLVDRNEFSWKKNEVEGEEEGVNRVEATVQRLETLVEKMIDMEMDKFVSRTAKDEILVEEKEEADLMSKEIVAKFLEKPIMYLRCGEGKLETRVKDLDLLIRMLESSFLKKDSSRTSHGCMRNFFS